MADFDLETPFPTPHGHDLPSDTPNYYLFNVESDHMPAPAYHRSLVSGAGAFLVDTRRKIMSLVLRLSRHYGSVTSYLAVNYADRFLSYHPFPEGKQWFLNLAAVCCVILALKMTKTEFSVSEIQQDAGAMFDMQNIERMEKLILGTLSWRMRSVTPFCFLDFFISTFGLEGPPPRRALKARARQIIFKTQTEVELLKFRPSLISVAALLSACDELFPLHFHCFKETTFDTTHINAVSGFSL
ncbi:unnamed protein product [Cuscuta campestris]|uniref:Cyclin-like domain-containing protein n=1 Tax=Cuscuta campestris TaxID=132261 RepID=A0A484M4G9_9ASTE|nr:unnamed protein product [Cuscuta campestris]